MSNILTKEVSRTGFSPLDAVLVAGAKVGTEAILARVPFVGNGTLKSGAIKVLGATLLTTMVKNRVGSILGTAMMVDGGEDIVRSLVGRFATTSSDASTVGGASSNQGSGVGGAI